MSSNWYLHRDQYWVPPDQADAFPVRQGDLFGPVALADGTGWDAALIVHPTRELGKTSLAHVQVTRVRPLSALPDRRQRMLVQAGFQERDGVAVTAFAHTFFVAPAPGGAPMWANLREIALAPRDQFTARARAGALTHDARVTFIRRYLYFRFRIALTFEGVRGMEARRIASDAAFGGPRPDWAESSGT